jgi:biopolymer transport protein ExbD
MGRFRELHNDDASEGGIDMSPMIDCVFILLIFFIVTTTFVEESGVDVDKPEAASSVRLAKNSMIFALTDKGEVWFDSHVVGIGAVRSLVSRKMLEEQVPVIIEVDQAASAGKLTRLIDEAKLGNAPIVSIATRKSAG